MGRSDRLIGSSVRLNALRISQSVVLSETGLLLRERPISIPGSMHQLRPEPEPELARSGGGAALTLRGGGRLPLRLYGWCAGNEERFFGAE
jgi:hypothetical protein